MSTRDERLEELRRSTTAWRTAKAVESIMDWVDGGDVNTGAENEPTDSHRQPVRRSGRPSYGPWDIRAARQALRDAGQAETHEAVINLLGWDRKTVRKYWDHSDPSGE